MWGGRKTTACRPLDPFLQLGQQAGLLQLRGGAHGATACEPNCRSLVGLLGAGGRGQRGPGAGGG